MRANAGFWVILAARGSRVPREMWVPLESKASLDHRVPRASGATRAWQGPRERRALMDIKAWWAPSVPLGPRVRKVLGDRQAELGRRATWAAQVFVDPRGSQARREQRVPQASTARTGPQARLA